MISVKDDIEELISEVKENTNQAVTAFKAFAQL